MTATPSYPHEAPSTGAAAVFASLLQSQLPQLETARLLLRAPRIEDFEVYATILMSERARYMDGPFSREDSWADFTGAVSNWLLRGHGPWTIVEKTSGTILGFVSVQMEVGDHEPELGYFLTEAAEGRGIAFEAARAARTHAIDTLALPALVSYIDPDNHASRRLAARLGAAEDRAAAARFADNGSDPVCVYRHHGPAGGA